MKTKKKTHQWTKPPRNLGQAKKGKGEKDQRQSYNKAEKSNIEIKRKWAYLKEAINRGSMIRS